MDIDEIPTNNSIYFTSFPLRGDTKIDNNIIASMLVALAMVGILISALFNATWIMLIPLLAIMFYVAKLSPPITALTLLFCWQLISRIDTPGANPHIPSISILTVWLVLSLIIWRKKDGSLSYLKNRTLAVYILLLLLFFAEGSIRAFQLGHLVNHWIAFYNWDIFRAWLGYLIIGILGCRNLTDFKVILVAWPFFFIYYLVSIPLEVWHYFFKYTIHAKGVLGVGISYGSLNANTLGQAASLACLLSACWALFIKPFTRSWWIMWTLTLICNFVVIITMSKQALLSLLIAWFAVGIILLFKHRKAFSWILLILFTMGNVALVNYWPDNLFLIRSTQPVANSNPITLPPPPKDSGIIQPEATSEASSDVKDKGSFKRIAEFTQSPDQWQTKSASIRVKDYAMTFAVWKESPIFGVGWGGQNFEYLQNLKQYWEGVNYALIGTHNLFLGILAQTGLVGLFLFLSFTLGILRHFWRKTAKLMDQDDTDKLRIIVAALIICLFVQMNISGGVDVGSAAMITLFGMLLGLISSQINTGIGKSIKS